MKAPDKIYLDIRYNNDEYPIEVFATRALASDVEYICKDALLGWAKEEKLDAMKKKVSSGANKDWEFYDFYKTQIKFWEDIVKHIESL